MKKILLWAALALLAVSPCAPIAAEKVSGGVGGDSPVHTPCYGAMGTACTPVDDTHGLPTGGDPGRRAAAVAPSDGTDLASVPRALFVGTGGNITMIGVDASVGATGILWKNVPSGAIIPFRPRRILATGTSAQDIVAIY